MILTHVARHLVVMVVEILRLIGLHRMLAIRWLVGLLMLSVIVEGSVLLIPQVVGIMRWLERPDVGIIEGGSKATHCGAVSNGILTLAS